MTEAQEMDPTRPIQYQASPTPCDSVEPLRSHSKLGLGSLLIALGLPLLFLIVFAIMILLASQIQNAALTNFVVILIASFVGAVGHLVGLILGIVGTFRKTNKKLLPVLGIIFNGIPMLVATVVCLLFVAFLINPFPLGPK